MGRQATKAVGLHREVEVQAVTPEQVEADVVAVRWPPTGQRQGSTPSSTGCSRGSRATASCAAKPAASRSCTWTASSSRSPGSAHGTHGARRVANRRPRRSRARPAATPGGHSRGRSTARSRCRSRSRRAHWSRARRSATTARWKADEAKPRLDSPDPLRRGRRARSRREATVATWTNRARNLVNGPPNETNPERLAAERARRSRRSLEPTSRRGARPRPIDRTRDGRRCSRSAAARDLGWSCSATTAEAAVRRRPRPRRQGDHLRHRRHLAQAVAAHGGDEGRHGRRRPP